MPYILKDIVKRKTLINFCLSKPPLEPFSQMKMPGAALLNSCQQLKLNWLLASSKHKLITISLNLTEKAIRKNRRCLQFLHLPCIILDVPSFQSFYGRDECHLAEDGHTPQIQQTALRPFRKGLYSNIKNESEILRFTSWLGGCIRATISLCPLMQATLVEPQSS